MTVSSVVYARVSSPRAFRASWTSRTVASPRPQISSITSFSSAWRAGGAVMALQAEARADDEALAALGDVPGRRVVAGLHAAQRAALHLDDLPGHDVDLRDRGV